MYQRNATLKKLRVVNLGKKADEKMIDREKALKTFNTYVSKYNPEDEKIKLKIEHIQRVAKNANDIAENLNLSKEDIDLAWLIGLLHDIGRFEQVRLYHTFNDGKSVNHAEIGVKILFEDGLIREFIEDKQYDEIIKIAILNHNRPAIETGLTERQLLHSKIIRDADKIDIYYSLTIYSKEAVWESKDLSNDIISDEIYREFKEDKRMNYKNRRSAADGLVCHFAYVYDFYYKYSLQIIDENNYIEKIYKRHKFNDAKTMERYNEIFNIAMEYVKSKMEKRIFKNTQEKN